MLEPARPALSGRQLLALALLAAGGPIGIDLYLPALPDISRDLDASPGAVQLTLYSFLLGFSLGQLASGAISDRIGRRRLLLLGSLAFAVLAGVCALAPSVTMLVAVRLVHGIAGAVGVAVSRAYVQDVAGHASAAAVFSFLAMITGVVPVVAPILGGALLGVGPWQLMFWAVSALAAGTFVLTWAVLPEPVTHRSHAAAQVRGGHRILLGDGGFVICIASVAVVSAVLFLFLAQTPFLLQEEFGLSATQYSMAFAACSLGAVLCSTLSSRLAGLVPPRTLIGSGLLLATSSSGLLVVSLLSHLPFAVVQVALIGCLSPLGLVLPNATAVALSRHPMLAGTASGILGVTQFGSSLVLAPLSALTHSSSTVAACAMFAFSAAGFAAYLTFGRRQLRHA